MNASRIALARRSLIGGFAATGLAFTALHAQPEPRKAPDQPKQLAETSTRLPDLRPAVIDNTLAIGGDDIAARKVETRMTVAVNVAGRGPFRFVVDSGADTSALGYRTARALNLAAGTPVTLHGITDIGIVDRVLVPELVLGQSTIRDLELPVLNDVDLGSDGLLGIDALVEQRLMMDFEKRVITVEDSRRPAVRMDGDIVVVARRRHGQLILTQASAASQPIDAVIDTGSEITIGNLALRDKLVRRTKTKLPVIPVTGVTGVTINLQMARLGELRIGPIVLHDIDIAFADVPPFKSFGLDDHPAMLLGTDLMENFRRISLDFRARKVRFQLKRCKPTSIMISTSKSWSKLSATDRDIDVC